MSPHNILGVPNHASKDEVKKAYRKLSLLHHPDKTGGDSSKFLMIKEAYEHIMAGDTRGIHDQHDCERTYISITRIFIDSQGQYCLEIRCNHMSSMETFMSKRSRYSTELFGINSGIIRYDRGFIVRNRFKLTLLFYSSAGFPKVREITFQDTRTFWRKVLDTLFFYFL